MVVKTIRMAARKAGSVLDDEDRRAIGTVLIWGAVLVGGLALAGAGAGLAWAAFRATSGL